MGPLTNSCLECYVIFETLTATVCAIVFIAVQHAKNTLHFPHFFGFQQFVCSHVKAELQPGYILQLLLKKINQNVIKLKSIQTLRKLCWKASIPLLRRNQLT
jgi:hypothetical protein